MQNVAVAPVPAVSRKMCESSKTPVPRRDKPPFERRCPSSQTGAEDCILAKPKYAKHTRGRGLLWGGNFDYSVCFASQNAILSQLR